MRKHNIAFIDLETTGLDPEKHEIIEIGCVLVKQVPRDGLGAGLEVIEEFDLKIKPEHIETADPEALAINGYNSADWLFAVDLPAAMKVVSEKTDGAILIAHNLTFDWLFLEKAFAKTGVPNKMDFRRLDLLSIAFAKLYDKLEIQRFSLYSLCKYFGIENERAHTALSDTRASVESIKNFLTSINFPYFS